MINFSLCEATAKIHESPDIKVPLTLVLLLNISALFLTTTVAYGIVASQSSCALLWSFDSCWVFAEVSKTPLDLLMYGFIAVSTERLIATLWYSYYFNNKHRCSCFILGVALLWTPSVISFVKGINTIRVPDQSPVIYCSSLSIGVHDFDFLITVHLPLCVLSITFCLTAIMISSRKKRQIQCLGTVESLKQHYQLLENIRTTKLVVPNVFSYCVTLIIHISALLYVHKRTFDSEVSFATSKEWSSFILPIYANVFPLIFLLGSEEFTRYSRCQSLLIKFKCRRKMAPQVTVFDYFRRP